MKNLVLILNVFLAISCGTQRGIDGQKGYDGFSTLKQETYGGREQAGHEVINSKDALAALYAELSIQDVPDVDFSKSTVVAVFMGQKSSGGFTISVDKANIKGDTAYIKKKETAPDGVATMALTNPYCVILLSKVSKVVVE